MSLCAPCGREEAWERAAAAGPKVTTPSRKIQCRAPPIALSLDLGCPAPNLKEIMPLLLFLAFVAVPIAEIALIIQVGGLIGLWPTVALIVLTAALGTMMVRAQGFAVLQRIRENMETGVFPARALLDGAALLLGGVLLLLPGFVTDAIGLLLLVPATRGLIGRALWAWIAGATGRRARRHGGRDAVIDAEFHEIPPERLEDDRRR